jgi:conjugative relaxase-like TrwC/TraI family protein
MAKVSLGREGYYVKLVREDYYQEGGEPPGKFLGKGAERLDLAETSINQGDKRLYDLCRGVNPHDKSVLRQGATTERIYRTSDGKEDVHKPVCAYDFTLSAPKSVSVLWGSADSEFRKKVEHCHFKSVEAAANYLEDRFSFTRSGHAGSIREKGDPIFAAFQHSVSRETEPNRGADPQLHTHLLMLNVVLREDGRGGALDSRGLYNVQHVLGGIYRESLKHELSKELNLQFIAKPLDKGVSFEVKGVPQELCREKSSRRQQIEKEILSTDTASQVQAKVLETRRPKQKNVISRDELFAGWRRDSLAQGFDANHLIESRLKARHFRLENERSERLAKDLKKVISAVRSEEYRLTREKHLDKIDQRYRRALARGQQQQQSFNRKMLFLYATHRISRSQYRQHTQPERFPKSKLGIHLAYAAHRISKSQQLYLLHQHGHSTKGHEPKSKLALTWAYATKRISEVQYLTFMAKNGHFRAKTPEQIPSESKQINSQRDTVNRSQQEPKRDRDR